MGVTNKSPAFIAKFPLGKIPALECADGFCLTESQAIARFLAESGPKVSQLVGSDAKTRALVEQWACFADQELAAQLLPIVLMCKFKMIPFDEARYAQSVANLERALRRLEVAVKEGKYLVGGQVSLADVMVAGPLHLASTVVLDKEMRKEVPGVVKYLEGLLEIPELKGAFGALEWVETRVKA
jgi:elongation factor 1-gamma